MSFAISNKSKKFLKWGTVLFAIFLTAFLQPAVSLANVLQQLKPMDFNGTGFTKDNSVTQSGGAFTLALSAPVYKVSQSITSISGITGTVFDGTNLWVANNTISVYKVNPVTGSILATITAGVKNTGYAPATVSLLAFDGSGSIYARARRGTSSDMYTIVINTSTDTVSTTLISAELQVHTLYGNNIRPFYTNGILWTIPQNGETAFWNSNGYEVNSYGYPVVSNPVSIGTFMYVASYTGNILKVDSMAKVTRLSGTPGSNSTSLATDGTYIYAKVRLSGQKIYKIDTTSGVSTVLGANVFSGDITYKNSYLWATDPSTNTINKIDPSTGAIVKSSVISGNPASMIFTGTDDFWFVNSASTSLNKVSSVSSYPIDGYHTVQTPVVDMATLGYKGLNTVAFTQSVPASTNVKWLVSIDRGVTWQTFTSGKWQSAVLANVGTVGMDVSVLQALTLKEWGLLNASSVTFAFGMVTPDSSVTPSVSGITLNGVVDVAKISLSAAMIYPDNKISVTSNVASGYTAKDITIDFGDGSASHSVTGKDKVVVDHKYTTVGAYTIKADVTLSTGETDTATVTLDVQKAGATASIKYKNLDDGNSPTQFYFQPVVTFDSSIDSVNTYEWTVKGSDGLPLQLGVGKKGIALYSVFGKSFLPVFSVPGDYTIDLKVTANYADPVIASTIVTVGTFVIPTLDIKVYSPEHNRPSATYTFKASSQMRKDKITSFLWKIIDPNGVVIVPTVQRKVNKVMTAISNDRPNITFTFEKAGVWNVEASTTTKNYGWQIVAKKQITVNANQPPVIKDIVVNTYASGLTKVKVDATDSDGKIKIYTLDLGDGMTSVYNQLKHTYAKSGIYTIKATVTDDSGATASMQKDVTVNITQ